MKFTHCKSTIHAKLVDLKDQVFICSKIILVECQGNTQEQMGGHDIHLPSWAKRCRGHTFTSKNT